MAKILNAKEIRKINHGNQKVHTMKVYNNHGDSMLTTANQPHEIREMNGRKVRLTVHKSSPKYEESAKQAVIHQQIEDCIHLCKKKGVTLKTNITHYPAGAENLFDLLRQDITARILDLPDITGFIAKVIQNDNFTDPWYAQWFYEYVAPFLEFTGRGDPVNLLQIKTGDKTSINFTIYGVGFEQDLYNQLFNNIFDAMKVTAAVSKGYVLRKNELVLNPIVNFGYPAAKTVATATTGTYEENIYDTMQNALTALGLLRDYQTGEYVDVSQGVYLMIHPTKVRHVNRSINGGLTPGSQVKNLNPISEILRIIPNQARTQRYGNKTISYSGCGLNDFYMFIPKMYFWLALKRDLTHVTGEGDTFGITSEREAWYFVESVFADHFFGGDTDDDATSDDPTVITQDMGWIVTGTLPTVDENT